MGVKIIESLMLEKTFKLIEYNHESCPLNHVLKMGCTLESTDG